ncbi:hypothetical protein SynMVIR181_02006 [Synechococcus sp. MVIR-18-1]|nr:hypothetical protein SynMVIR181_02006 [Synechococcus sp. MVIR-18-1]
MVLWRLKTLPELKKLSLLDAVISAQKSPLRQEGGGFLVQLI